MQVKEILRVKGSRLLSIEPGGRAVDAVTTMAKENLGSLVVLDIPTDINTILPFALGFPFASRGTTFRARAAPAVACAEVIVLLPLA